MAMHYQEIRGGSILKHIRYYNKRDDTYLTGEYSLVNPRPFGDTCGEFLSLCQAARRLPENRLAEYQPEHILLYQPGGDERLNPLNKRDVKLVDIYLKKGVGCVEIEYTIDASVEDYDPQKVSFPILYMPLFQIAVSAKIGDNYFEKYVVSLSRYGAVVHNIAAFNESFRWG